MLNTMVLKNDLNCSSVFQPKQIKNKILHAPPAPNH